MDIDHSHAERKRREQVVQALADEFRRDVAEVLQLYERAYVALKSEATVKDYLPLFVERRTRALLLAQQGA